MINPNSQLKILMLEDLEDDAGLIERSLHREGLKFEARRVDSQEAFTSTLASFSPDVVLSDHALPNFNSLEALRICRQQSSAIPFILVTGTVSEEFAVSCLKLGADDYVLKTNLVRLPAAIQNALKQRRDEAHRKKAEQTLRRQNEELIKINKELDNFVYSVSHNLRAPLMSVLGLINLAQLENRNGHKPLDRYFDMMLQSIHKLDDTLKEILTYSRNARSALTVSRVNISKTIEEGVGRLQYMEGWDDVQKVLRAEGRNVFSTDGYRLGVIINNLVSNAIKYRDAHKNPCTLEVVAQVDVSTLTLTVRDNGIGISDDYLPRIFDMFFRATERSEGAGLGLYIVRETIEKLHGRIGVESRAGEGTTFTVVIPEITERPENGANQAL